jgi:pseudouridine-5'-phosphate glycosidase
MIPRFPDDFILSSEITQASCLNRPIVALESTVITHGLPYPENRKLALDMENEVRSQGAVPATIAVLDGNVHIGLTADQIERLAVSQGMCKISSRDFAVALAQRQSGGTTVAGSLVVAHLQGIRVFATGGIGGVHRQAPFDISADLMQLARTPIIVVCAGAKAILDLPATVEMLETLGVPVVGYQTDYFPAFYSRSSGLKANSRVESPEDIVKIAHNHWAMGLQSAVLVTVTPPSEVALPDDIIQTAVQQALDDAKVQDIHGQAVTPFLLRRVSDLTQGASLLVNLALLLNNARIAAQIARALDIEIR